MPSREIKFGLHNVRRPGTSPTRRGDAGKSKPQPHSPHVYASQPRPALTPSPPRPLVGAVAASLSSSGRPQRSAAAEGKTLAAPTSTRATATAASSHTAAAQGFRVHPGASFPLSSSAPQLRPVNHTAASSFASSYLEDHIRYLVHLTGAPVLLPSLLDILHGVLRLLQHDRAQQKGQQPCRRHSSVSGNNLESEVTCCLTQAAQATSPPAAASLLEQFLVQHAAVTIPVPTSPPLTSSPTSTCSPLVLVGTTLAELYFSDRAPSCNVSPSVLLSYLDTAVAVGHSGAMVIVGVCLRDGRGGVSQNVSAGLAWLRCAASTGYLPAMHELGETYEVGVQRLTTSSSHFSLSRTDSININEGDEDDQEVCGVDWGEAVRWYWQAAEAGYAQSQLNLGKLLLLAAEQSGHDATADTSAVDHLGGEAKRWLQVCAAAGVEEAVRLLKRLKPS